MITNLVILKFMKNVNDYYYKLYYNLKHCNVISNKRWFLKLSYLTIIKLIIITLIIIINSVIIIQ